MHPGVLISAKRAAGGKRRSIGSPDSSLLRRVQRESGQKVAACFQCRKCSSGCPVTFAMDYLPDVVMRLVQLGLKDRVLGSRTIWVCASCQTCTTRCPNDIDIAGVIDTLRRMALSEGKVHPAARDIPALHQAFLGSIKSGGRVHEVGMLLRYIPRTNLWARLLSGELLAQARVGLGLFRRGKLGLVPHRIRSTGEIRKLFGGTRK